MLPFLPASSEGEKKRKEEKPRNVQHKRWGEGKERKGASSKSGPLLGKKKKQKDAAMYKTWGGGGKRKGRKKKKARCTVQPHFE